MIHSKKITSLIFLSLFLACKENPKHQNTATGTVEIEKTEPAKSYPEALHAIFEAHGGLDLWKQQRTLTFDLPKPDAPETHTIALSSRKEKIASPKVTMGYDGDGVWVLDEKKAYKGDAAFYHNLMFYFYAMPFVLADNGINYGDTENLEYEGKSYPGIRISYNSGIGASPKDEYYLHYDPETHQMAWLGYTVTYGSGEKSDNVRWVRYNDWQSVAEVKLPKSISWHNYEGRTIKESRNTVTFENVTLSEKARPDSFYAKPDNAEFVKKEM
ncbi:DUF6503 family protein [Maribacter sp. 2304DJ31-5]|uniref:DUF6503 family protein n=1 Tax=Maribacter sp. 2304DJ31-5 TaxID=3386273 RepID=UPI0039BCAF18